MVEGAIEHMALHGVVGCAFAEISGGDCAAGAVAAVAQSLYAGTLDGSKLSAQDIQKNAALIGGLAGFLASSGKGANVNLGSSIARSGIANNFLFHVELERKTALEAELQACLIEGGCNASQLRSLAEGINALDELSLARDVEMLAYCQVANMVSCILAMSNSGMADAYNEYDNYLKAGGEITPEIMAEMDRLQAVKYAAMNRSAELTVGLYRIQMGLGAGVAVGAASAGAISAASAVLRCAAIPGCLANLGRGVGTEAIGEFSAGGMTVAIVAGKLTYEAGGKIVKIMDDAGHWLRRVDDIATDGRALFRAENGTLHVLDDAGALVGLRTGVDDVIVIPNGTNRVPVPDDLPTNIHMGGQGKHIPGHNNYDPSRSTLTADPQDLLAGVHSGQYPIIRSIPRGNSTSNIVDFGRPIGDFKVDGVLVGPTRYGQIVQGKNGAHIIPANPNQY